MNRKLKIAAIAVGALIVLLVVGAIALRLSLSSIVKVGVETIGPRITGAKVTVESVSFKLLKGELAIKGFELGNPQGFDTSHALKTEKIFLKLRPSSLLSSKIIVDSIVINGVDMNYEQGFTSSNLTTLKSNAEEFSKVLRRQASPTADAKQPEGASSSSSGRKLQVDHVEISGIKVALSVRGLGGNALPLPVPGISLSNLGNGPDGITPADLGITILDSILNGTLDIVKSALPSMKEAADALGNGASKALDGAKDGASKVVDGAKGAVDSVLGIFGK